MTEQEHIENARHIEYFKGLLSPIFPLKSEIDMIGEHKTTIEVSWPMPEDGRLTKYSRPIHIVFTFNLLSDYHNNGPISRETFDGRLLEYIQTKYKGFKPAHDKPKETSAPKPEVWVVPLDLFG